MMHKYRLKQAVTGLTFLAALWAANLGWTQSFQVGPGAPTVPLVFVAAKNNCVITSTEVTCTPHPGSAGAVNFGADAGNSRPANTSSLYVLSQGVAQLVFPIPGVDDAIVDQPLSPYNGAIGDTNVSIDGNSVLISYYHNITANSSTSPRDTNAGADIYRIDFSTFGPAVNPASLPRKRLTFQPRNLFGTVNAFAMNLATAGNTLQGVGVENNGPVEILANNGVSTKLIWASTELRLRNSNTNHLQFQLFEADFDAAGNLINKKQFAPMTTSSAISPTNARDGVYYSLSYINDERSWRLEQLTSTALQKPAMGYAIGSFVAVHNATTLNTGSGSPNDDILASAAYYPGGINNNGFGNIALLPLRTQGTNVESFVNFGGSTYRTGQAQKDIRFLFGNIDALQDHPAPCVGGQIAGKVSTPYGAPNGLFMAHAYGAASSREPQVCGGQTFRGDFRSQLVFVSTADYATTIADVRDTTRVKLVLRDTSEQFSLIRPMALAALSARLHSAPQATGDFSNRDPEPFGLLGTSRLDNTDVRPINCFNAYRNGFSPQMFIDNDFNTNQMNHANVAVQYWKDPGISHNASCTGMPILPQSIGWLAFYATDNKTGEAVWNAPDNDRKETHKLLGAVAAFGQAGRAANDTSAYARIPANTPVTFRTLSRRYGLATNRAFTWHQVRPAERRHDCGGCHGHTEFNAGNATPFENTYAATHPPVDLANQTIYIDYDASCNPVETVLQQPSMAMPVWEDVFPGVVQNCASCHTAGQSGAAAFVVNAANPGETLQALKDLRYVEPLVGALGSQMFWAARGERTDGQDNQFFLNSTGRLRQYVYNPAHNNLPTCNGSNLDAARWVKQVGDFIDGGGFSAADFHNGASHADRFQPTFALALGENTTCTAANGFNVGVWDDTGSVAKIEIFRTNINAANRIQQRVGTTAAPLNNGSFAFNFNGVATTDKLIVVVTDAAGNRMMEETSIPNMINRCLVGNSLPPIVTNGFVGLSLQKNVAANGAIQITITVDAPGATDPNASVMVPGSRLGGGAWNVTGFHFGFAYDQPYTDLTVGLTTRPLVNGQAIINFEFPAGMLNASGITNVLHQAVVLNQGVFYGASNPVGLVVQAPAGSSGSGSGGSGGFGGPGTSGGGFSIGKNLSNGDSSGEEGSISSLFGCQTSRTPGGINLDFMFALVLVGLMMARQRRTAKC